MSMYVLPTFSRQSTNPQTPRTPRFISSQTPRQKSLNNHFISNAPLKNVGRFQKIAAVVAAIFAGLALASITYAIGMMITAMISIPLMVEETQRGVKKIAQYAIQNFVQFFGTSTTILISIQTGVNVGKSVYEKCISV